MKNVPSDLSFNHCSAHVSLRQRPEATSLHKQGQVALLQHQQNICGSISLPSRAIVGVKTGMSEPQEVRREGAAEWLWHQDADDLSQFAVSLATEDKVSRGMNGSLCLKR